MKWFEQNPERLAIEGRLLKQHYPEAQLVKKNGRLRVWVGVRGQRGVYQCELLFPERYPWATPSAYVRSPKLEPSPHQFSDGQLCLHHSEDVGPQTTAVVYIRWLGDWIKRYEGYLAHGEWRD